MVVYEMHIKGPRFSEEQVDIRLETNRKVLLDYFDTELKVMLSERYIAKVLKAAEENEE